MDDESYAVSTYRGKPATKNDILSQLYLLCVAFPQITPEFVAILADQIVSEKWTLARVTDAVKHVLQNCEYPTFTPAKLLSFDKKKKLYNYSGYCGMILRGQAVHEDFGKIKVGDRVFWYLIHENL